MSNTTQLPIQNPWKQVVSLQLFTILWMYVMKPIAAPIVGGMITSTVHVLILVPVFFVMTRSGRSGGEFQKRWNNRRSCSSLGMLGA